MEYYPQILYDCVVIGGGPAGLSAAIYLGRFKRSVLIIDGPDGGRWETHEINENYFGFPDGIPTIELRQRGIQQAKKFGAEMVIDTVTEIGKKGGLFYLSCDKTVYIAKSIIFATGVKDRFPQFECMEECLGKSLFWCITCDGYKTINKKVLVVGYTDEALTTAMQFLNYTPKIEVVTNHEPGAVSLNSRLVKRLADHGITVHEGKMVEVVGKGGEFQLVRLSTGPTLTPEFMFSMQGASPNSQLATSLGVNTNALGYIEASIEQRTNIAGIYAAGDVTKAFAHQIVTAAHEGSAAAQAVNYDLYLPDQRE